MYILTIAPDIKITDQKEHLKVFYGKIDITHIVAKVFAIDTKEIGGETVILNASGMGISIKDYLETKIKLDENKLIQPICDYLMTLEK